ncbi:MAG: DUF5678 domain-containing protein [Nanoarchaeota archaeon]|nr:DUF5678 domain-containing protein [Nanoarchaeota archaeon]
MTEATIQQFNLLEESSSFLSRNFRNLQKEYGNKYIAIKDSKIIAFALSFEDLIKQLHLKKAKRGDVIIEFIPAEGEIIYL